MIALLTKNYIILIKVFIFIFALSFKINSCRNNFIATSYGSTKGKGQVQFITPRKQHATSAIALLHKICNHKLYCHTVSFMILFQFYLFVYVESDHLPSIGHLRPKLLIFKLTQL